MLSSMRWLGLVGLAAFTLLPWFGVEYGIFEPDWVRAGGLLAEPGASGLLLILQHGHWHLIIPGAALVGLVALSFSSSDDERLGRLALFCAVVGIVSIVVPAFLERWTGIPLVSADRKLSTGYGAFIVALACFLCATTIWSRLGKSNRDAFVVSAIASIVVLVSLFVFYPILHILARAVDGSGGGLFSSIQTALGGDLWGLRCFIFTGRCGVVVNTVILGILTASSTTMLGLAFALLMTRSRFPSKALLRAVTILPIITPPFVVGLSLIFLFGRAGWVTTSIADLFGMEPSRWFYGIWGVWLGQTLSFTPIAFLVMIGVVQGVSPSLEEAAQTLRASARKTMLTVSLPLFRPGIANAFLIGFIESLADFGNPLVLGGNFSVLSTEIYFAVVGAQEDPGRAAVLALLLLMLTLSVFMMQRYWIGNGSYATITGKADNGAHAPLARSHAAIVYGLTVPWLCLTLVVYSMIFYGSFVALWGQNNTLTLVHYRDAFGIAFSDAGIQWTGSAWDSFWTTLSIAAVAAPLTAAIGLLTAWLLTRQNFAGKPAFEFATMLSFAIPGTVVGVSYILAFNVPPIEITGTGIILILCFVFRNMPVGVRGGIAALKQIDKSLDEASLTLGGNSFQTLRYVILPLLRPAIVAAIAYAFIRAITSVSAVIFLVSADHNMATSYIIGLVENGSYGVAIAYCAVLIVVMLVVVLLVQSLFGNRRLRRTERVAHVEA